MKTHLILATVAILILQLSVAAMASAPTRQTSGLGGRVIDSVDHHPLAGVQVDVFADGALHADKAVASTRTRGDGSFSLLGLHGGSYRLELSKRGYALEIVTGVLLAPGVNIRISPPFGLRSAVVMMGIGQSMETRI
jgi:hypothetical protein